MIFEYSIERTEVILIDFVPTKARFFISETPEEINGVMVKNVCFEQTDEINNVIRMQSKKVPITDLQSLISSYDFATGKPSINIQALNYYIRTSKIKINE